MGTSVQHVHLRGGTRVIRQMHRTIVEEGRKGRKEANRPRRGWKVPRWDVRVPAMMSSVGLDAAALGALVHHLAGFQVQAFDELFGSVPFGHSSLSRRWRTKKHDEQFHFPFEAFFWGADRGSKT